MSGLKERDLGHIGVIRIEGTNGCTIEPPELKLYAVEPVGVLRQTPSAVVLVKNSPSM
jgi:hypothetical protein